MLVKLSEIIEADIIDIMNNDSSVRPVHERPAAWRKSISGFEINELFYYKNGEREQIGFVKKVKLLDKASAGWISAGVACSSDDRFRPGAPRQ